MRLFILKLGCNQQLVEAVDQASITEDQVNAFLKLVQPDKRIISSEPYMDREDEWEIRCVFEGHFHHPEYKSFYINIEEPSFEQVTELIAEGLVETPRMLT